MVEDLVKSEIKEHLIDMFGQNSAALIDYAFTCTILDVNRCRIAAIKKYYYSLLPSHSCKNAKEITAEKYCLSVKSIEKMIYEDFYSNITLSPKQ